MSKKKKQYIDPRDVPLQQDVLEYIAQCPTGGSGNGEYISGRIQSMAREILLYRDGAAQPTAGDMK